jgi:LuxR family maltose regulon positive regulatory protein
VADELRYRREFEHMTLARLLIAQHKAQPAQAALQEALDLLARLCTAAEHGGRIGSVIEIRLIEALAHAADQAPQAALNALNAALVLAEPEGYVQTFLDEGPVMVALLRQALAAQIRPDYVGRLLAGVAPEDAPLPAGTEPSQSANQTLVEPLSERELEVLDLIAQGLSNREIAARLVIALSTVKGHNRVIFGKLQVQRRTEAVAVARALGLV